MIARIMNEAAAIRLLFTTTRIRNTIKFLAFAAIKSIFRESISLER